METMIHSVSGILVAKQPEWAVVETGGIGLKTFMAARDLQSLPDMGKNVKLFCYLHVREDAMELYGFLNPRARSLFELLIAVSGVGPRSALAILGVTDLNDLQAAIQEGRPDVLTRASGIGKKTAERIILELRGKVGVAAAEAIIEKMEGDADIVDALVGLGYKKTEARVALGKVDKDITGVEDRLKATLKILK